MTNQRRAACDTRARVLVLWTGKYPRIGDLVLF